MAFLDFEACFFWRMMPPPIVARRAIPGPRPPVRLKRKGEGAHEGVGSADARGKPFSHFDCPVDHECIVLRALP